MREMSNVPGAVGRAGAMAAAVVLGVTLVTGGCGAAERDRLTAEKQKLSAENEQLTDENRKLSNTLQSLEAESAEANAILEDVQKGLEQIRARELKLIQSSIRVAEEGRAAGGKREQLEAEIQMIRKAVRRNLQKLASLEKTNRENGVKIASLEKLTNELRASLQEKDATLAELEARVGNLSKVVESQATSLAEKDAAIHEGESRIAQTTRELHTAYVAVASRSLLKEKGVVEKRGDILGIGGRWIETGKFDPDLFREIDVTREVEIPIPAPASKVRVVTEQPKASYRIVNASTKAGASTLEVTDPASFWKGDRYLVVMLPE